MALIRKYRVISSSIQPMFAEFERFMGRGSNSFRRVEEPVSLAHVHTPVESAEHIVSTEGDSLLNQEIITSVPGFEKWIPFAASAYNISANPDDYLFRPVPAILTDLPNRNGVGFPADELIKWNLRAGCQSYRSWVGKPVHVEHGNWHPDPQDPDPTLAIGVIVDVAMTPLVGFGDNKLWKIMMLVAIDRTKDPERAREIESGDLNTYSMGALVDGYTCSFCGSEVGKCSHIDPEDSVTFYKHQGVLVYKLCRGIEGVEISSVRDPAYAAAISDVSDIRY